MINRLYRWWNWPTLRRQSELRRLYDMTPVGVPIPLRSLSEAEFLHEYARGQNPYLDKLATQHQYVKSNI